MRRAIWILLFLLSAALLVNIVKRVAPVREPVYQGKPLRFWLVDLDSTSLATRDWAKAALREMGTNAVPPLIQILESTDSPLKLLLNKLIARQSLFRIHFQTAGERHLTALRGCRALGSLARPAIPELIRFLNQGELAHEAAYSLSVIDENLFPLTRAATNRNNEIAVRVAIIARLAFGQYDEAAVLPALLMSLEDENPAISSRAACSLGLLHKEPRRVVPALLTGLDNPDPVVRRESASALGRFGNAATEAVPILSKTCSDPARAVRKAAVNAMKQIGLAATAQLDDGRQD